MALSREQQLKARLARLGGPIPPAQDRKVTKALPLFRVLPTFPMPNNIVTSPARKVLIVLAFGVAHTGISPVKAQQLDLVRRRPLKKRPAILR